MEDILKILGDENRLKIVRLLSVEKLCVCELEMLLELTQSNVSRHLGKLKRAGVITSIKDAQWIHYQMDSDFLSNHKLLYDYVLKQFEEKREYIDLKDRLTKYKGSKFDCTDIRSDIETVKKDLYKCNC